MRKRFSRPMALLLIPIILGAVVGGVRWKQLHPTPTPFDLQERTHLSKAKIINVQDASSANSSYFSLPSDEFRAVLNDFYFKEFLEVKNAYSLQTAPTSTYKIVVRADTSSSEPLATIFLDELPRYESPQNHLSLHPVTERRLRELVAKYRSAK